MAVRMLRAMRVLRRTTPLTPLQSKLSSAYANGGDITCRNLVEEWRRNSLKQYEKSMRHLRWPYSNMIRHSLAKNLRSSKAFCRSTSQKMSSSTGPMKQEWLVIVPDMKDSAEKRPGLGPKHVEQMLPTRGSLWLLGGMILKHEQKEGSKPLVSGNALIAYAETREEVLKVLKEDCYSTDGVWDIEKVQIYPFKSLFRKGLGFD